MRSRRLAENDMLREIILLQAKHGWTWTVVWIPRALNDAADALSKNDAKRFWSHMTSPLEQKLPTQAQLALPRRDHTPWAATRHPRLRTLRGRTSIRPAKLHADLAKPAKLVMPAVAQSPTLHQRELRAYLTSNLACIDAATKPPGDNTGTRYYLKLCRRMGITTTAEAFPTDPDDMTENLRMMMVDCVIQYTLTNDEGQLTTKTPVAVNTATTYVREAARFWQSRGSQRPELHSRDIMKATAKTLRNALPQDGKQKHGLTAANVTDMIAAATRIWGPNSKEAAAWALKFVGLMRPGELVTTPAHPTYAVYRHPSVGCLRFFDSLGKIVSPHEDGANPTGFSFTIKTSKTDSDRLTKDVVVGITGHTLCAVSLMWRYLKHRGPCGPHEPLFANNNGSAWSYAQMRRAMTASLTLAGMPADQQRNIGGHSFRIGGAQALALARKPAAYIMAYGRWRCMQSLLRYIETPYEIRLQDAKDMIRPPEADISAAEACATAMSLFSVHALRRT
jgi:hypothetical protein